MGGHVRSGAYKRDSDASLGMHVTNVGAVARCGAAWSNADRCATSCDADAYCHAYSSAYIYAHCHAYRFCDCDAESEPHGYAYTHRKHDT